MNRNAHGAREHREFLPDDAEKQEPGDDLRRGKRDPAETEIPGNARTRDERTHGAVGRDKRHRENDAPEAAVRDEVIALKVF